MFNTKFTRSNFSLLILLLMFATPVAYATDWNDYAIVCSDGANVVIYTDEGNPDLRDGTHRNLTNIVIEVKKMMKEGWQPLGSFVVQTTKIMCQTVVKK